MPKFMMDVAQGTDEWKRLRMGKATASNFSRIVTEVKGEYSAGATQYAREVAVQRLIGEDTERPIDNLYWVSRGKLLEPDAVKHYETVRGRVTDAIGLIVSDDDTAACSPDRIGADRLWGVEIKSPSGPEHLKYWDDGGPGSKYRWQVVGSLLISQFEGWDWVSYHPNLQEVIVPYRRKDYEADIETLRKALVRFEKDVQLWCEKIQEAGFVQPIGQMKTRSDEEWRKMEEADQNMWAFG